MCHVRATCIVVSFRSHCGTKDVVAEEVAHSASDVGAPGEVPELDLGEVLKVARFCGGHTGIVSVAGAASGSI
jgi:hypothetical protein